MDIEKFIERSPFLYHLTYEQNAKSIVNDMELFSANALIDMTRNTSNAVVKTHKRFTSYSLNVNNTEIFLRDQRPISELALGKCLTHGWSVAEFLYHLNDRVFMWPNINRLERHFNRYKAEHPLIFRFSTRDLLQANPYVKFCRLNSGATRANSYLGGKAPARGKDTFLSADKFTLSPNSVAEVTFEKKCLIAGDFGIDITPYGNFKNRKLK